MSYNIPHTGNTFNIPYLDISYEELKNHIITQDNDLNDILIDIYYNTGEIFKSKSINHNEDIDKLKKYIDDFNYKYNKNYKIKDIKKNIDIMKKYKNKLYNTEYTKPGENYFNNDYCENSKSISQIKTDYKNVNKLGEYTFLTYNIHSFIKQCSYITPLHI
jgi:hypothetical protein